MRTRASAKDSQRLRKLEVEPHTPCALEDHGNGTSFPSYLAQHTGLGTNSEDVATLISSIDTSQVRETSQKLQLPAEILLRILEHVPVDYILSWRLICRGFREAIDGRILYHHLRRTTLIGYMGPKHLRFMENLDDEEYEKIHLLRAYFQHVENKDEDGPTPARTGPIWNGTYAIFQIEDEWYHAFREIVGSSSRWGGIVEDVDTKWLDTLDRLQLQRAEEGFGTLRWCMRLDHAVLDMDFPLEAGRGTFDIDVNLHLKFIRVSWKAMLFGFLKTEAALRTLMEKKRDSTFTYNHTEDCLRYIRRQRFHASLDQDKKVDRHIKWSIRLLKPLFGMPRHDHRISLEDVENDAVDFLILLRREASMSTRYIAYLHTLAAEYEAMDAEIHELHQTFDEFRNHFVLPSIQFSMPLPVLRASRLNRNPIAWHDEMKRTVEEQVAKWRAQKKVIEKLQVMLSASNQALQVPDDSFDDLENDF